MPTVTVSTDCSGMEAPIQALRNPQIKFQHNFSCDNDKFARVTIEANFPPKGEIYTDIKERNNKGLYNDVYVAGFPCQPFSIQGLRQGFGDTRGRGAVFLHVLNYINVNKPKLVILENVKGLR